MIFAPAANAASAVAAAVAVAVPGLRVGLVEHRVLADEPAGRRVVEPDADLDEASSLAVEQVTPVIELERPHRDLNRSEGVV